VPTATLELAYRPLAAPDATAASGTQLSATINLPGYTRAPRGRAGQAAVWWPLPGDSVIVHFQPPQGTGLVDLRGALHADTLAAPVSPAAQQRFCLACYLPHDFRRRLTPRYSAHGFAGV
jgi:hypothetical protein